MAIKMSMHQQVQLFESLFGPKDPVTNLAISLVTNGALIDVSLYVVKINYKGQTHTQTLTVGTSALMKQSVTPLLIQQNKFMLKTFLEGVAGVQAPEVNLQVPVQPTVFGVDFGTETKVGPPMGVAATQASPTVQSIAKPGGVIKLKNATALGQKVEGTSSGSVYRVVALNKRVKIATRINVGEVSMRVEWDSPTAAEKQALTDVFSMKSGYGSLHASLGNVPAHRVIGALLFSINGLEFDQIAHGSKQVGEANA